MTTQKPAKPPPRLAAAGFPTKEQLQRAFLYFRRHFYFRDTDEMLDPFLAVPKPDENCHPPVWLKLARQALNLRAEAVGKKLGLTDSGYTRLEATEASGKIPIGRLAEAAAAMDCELVYAIRPRRRVPFAAIVWEEAWPEALEHHWVKSRPERLKAQALAAMARDLIQEAAFRRKKGWSAWLHPDRPKKRRKRD